MFKLCLTILRHFALKDIEKMQKIYQHVNDVVSECHNALGMEDESIPDESITATSYIEDYFPWYARVRKTRSNSLGAAWCTNITSGNQSLTVSANFGFYSVSTIILTLNLEAPLNFIY